MFVEVKTLAERTISGDVEPQALQQAATDHLNSMDQGEITDHLQTAATNLQNQGQPDLAQRRSASSRNYDQIPAEERPRW